MQWYPTDAASGPDQLYRAGLQELTAGSLASGDPVFETPGTLFSSRSAVTAVLVAAEEKAGMSLGGSVYDEGALRDTIDVLNRMGVSCAYEITEPHDSYPVVDFYATNRPPDAFEIPDGDEETGRFLGYPDEFVDTFTSRDSLQETAHPATVAAEYDTDLPEHDLAAMLSFAIPRTATAVATAEQLAARRRDTVRDIEAEYGVPLLERARRNRRMRPSTRTARDTELSFLHDTLPRALPDRYTVDTPWADTMERERTFGRIWRALYQEDRQYMERDGFYARLTDDYGIRVQPPRFEAPPRSRARFPDITITDDTGGTAATVNVAARDILLHDDHLHDTLTAVADDWTDQTDRWRFLGQRRPYDISDVAIRTPT